MPQRYSVKSVSSARVHTTSHGRRLMLAAFDHAGRPRGPFEEHLDEIAEAVRRDLEVAANAEDAVCGLSALIPGISASEPARNPAFA